MRRSGLVFETKNFSASQKLPKILIKILQKYEQAKPYGKNVSYSRFLIKM